MPFGTALGHRLRQVREESDRTAEQVTSHARLCGLNWERSTLTRIELGQRQVTAAELMLLPLVFGRPVAELLPTEPVALTEAAAVSPEGLRRVLTGPTRLRQWRLPRLWDAVASGLDRMKPVLAAHQRRYPSASAFEILLAAEAGWTDETTGKAATRLGVSRETVAVAAQQRWGRGLVAERDARLEDAGAAPTARARQAQRGHITRTLLDELRPVTQELQQAQDESDETNHEH